MKYRKTFREAFEEVKSRNLKEQEEQKEFSGFMLEEKN